MSALTLTLHQPMQIGDQARSDALLPTLRHIPGAVVRGALAAAWIARHGPSAPGTPRRSEFLALFEGDVRYGPLFSGQPFRSLAVLAHKYPAEDACTHDDLDEVDFPDAPSACPDCGSPWEPDKSLPDEPGVVVRRRTSVVLDPSGVAKSGGLYSRDTLPPTRADGSPLSFTGSLVVADPKLLQAIAALETIRIGGRRTTHGQARIAVDVDSAPPLPQVFSDGRVVLRLRSPAVFVDASGRPTPRPGAHQLAPYFGEGAVVERAWYRWQSIGGWHVASGLPKPVELAVTAGSTYVVRPVRDVVSADLTRLARDGIGLRRHEGFGDLGAATPLRPGRIARDEERGRVGGLAALVGRAPRVATSVGEWAMWRQLLSTHADGNVEATRRLSLMIAEVADRGIADDLTALMAYGPGDLRDVLGVWP